MNSKLTELVFILDRSGSMHGLESDTIGGFNSMIDKQREGDGEVYVSTVLFSDSSEVIHDRVPIAKIEPMNDRQYVVGGCTALIDAIGGAVHHISNVHKYAREEDRPARTMFVIITDGMENASRRFSSSEVKRAIEEKKEKNGWEFIFLGANIDAVETARHFGIDSSRSFNYHSDKRGSDVNYSVLSDVVGCFRSSGVVAEECLAQITEDYESRAD